MTFDTLQIHYGELSTKGANRKQFIQCLTHNVRVALKSFPVEIKGNRDFIMVSLNGQPHEPVVSRLQEVAGIQRISLIAACGTDIKEISTLACELIAKEKGKTFKLETRRADKTYPLDSYGISSAVADEILTNVPSLEVDVHSPDIVMKVSLRPGVCLLSCHDYDGIGGYPLGMNGKVTMLLSGGIDSPVAAYTLIRRGLLVDCLHFASPPYTQFAVIDKLKDLLKKLNVYQNDIRLQIVPFTKLQEAIYANVPEPYCITVMRRMMLRIAEKVARKNHCLAIATGESVGQVASQTLESLITINDVTSFPVLRPLCVTDKLSIIELSKKLGTYEISIRPYEDCCTIFKPKKPKTKPRIDEAEEYEAKFDYEPLIDECVANLQSIYLSGGEEVFGKA